MVGQTLGSIFLRLGVNVDALSTGFSKAEKMMDKVATHMFYTGTRMTASVTAPILAAAGAAAKWGLEFDAAMTESLAIVNGVTPKLRKQMEETAMAMSRVSKFSAAEVATAYYDLASAGLTAQESLGAIGTVVKFAQAGMMDLSKSGEYLAGAVTSMGNAAAGGTDKISAMAHVSDLLTQANNMALGTIEDFANAINNKAGQALRIYNKSAEEGIAVLAAFAQQNIKGKVAGQQLYMVLRDLQRYSQANPKEWKKLGIEVYDAGGKMRNVADIIGNMEVAFAGLTDKQRQNALASLGIADRSKASMMALIGMSGAIRGYQDALEHAKGATDEVAKKQMEGLKNQLLALWHGFENVGIRIFQDFIPIIRQSLMPVVNELLLKIESMERSFRTVSPAVKEMLLALAGLAAGVGPLLILMSGFIFLIETALTPFTLLFKGWNALNTILTEGEGPMAEALQWAAAFLPTLEGLGEIIGTVLGLFAGWPAIVLATAATLVTLSGGFDNFYSVLSFLTAGTLPFVVDLFKNMGHVLYDVLGAIKDVSIGILSVLVVALEKFIGPVKEFFAWMATKGKAMREMLGGMLDPTGPSPLRKAAADFRDRWGTAAFGADPTAAEKFAAKNKASMMEQMDLINANHGMPSLPGGPTGKPNPDFDNPPNKDKHDIFKRFMTSSNDLERELKSAYAVGAPLEAVFEELGNDLDTIQNKSKLWGKNLQFFTQYYDDLYYKQKKFDDMTASEKERFLNDHPFGEEEIKIPSLDDLLADFDKTYERENDILKLTDRLKASYADYTSSKIDAIDTAERDELRALDNLAARDQTNYDEKKKLVEDYYEFLRKKAVFTTDTIVNTMEEQGVHSKATWNRLTYESNQAYNAMIASGAFTTEEIIAQWDKVYDNEQHALGHGTASAFRKSIGTLSEAFKTMGQVSDSAFGHVAQMIGNVIAALATAVDASEIFKKAIAKIQAAKKQTDPSVKKEMMVEGIADAVLAVGTLIAAMDAATSSGSRLMNMLGGASVGAEFGKSIGGLFGPMGAMIGQIGGAVIGTLIGVFRKPIFRKVMADVGRDWGVTISENLAKQIESDVKNIFGKGNRSAAELFNMADIIKEAGGVTSSNLEKFITSARDMFSLLHTGKFTLDQFQKAFGDTFKLLADEVDTMGGLASDQFEELINLAKQFGVRVKSVMDYLKEQSDKVSEGFNEIVQGFTGPLFGAQSEKSDLSKELDDLNKKADELRKKLTGTDIAKDGAATMAELVEMYAKVEEQVSSYRTRGLTVPQSLILQETDLKKRIDARGSSNTDITGDAKELADTETRIGEITARMKELDGTITNTLVHGQEHFDRLGRLALAAFNIGIASGKSFMDVIKELGPSLEALSKAQKDQGLTANDAFQHILNIAQFVKDNPDLANAADGLNKMMEGVFNSSYMTPQTLTDLGDEAAHIADQMTRAGMSTQDMFMIMQPSLQHLWEISKRMNVPLSEGAQALLNQAEAAGVVGDQFRDASERMVQGINTLIDRFDTLLEGLGLKMPEAASDAGGAMADAVSPVVNAWTSGIDHIADEWNALQASVAAGTPVDTAVFSGSWTPSVPGVSLPGMASGGYFDGPTAIAIGEAGPEYALPENRLRKMMAAAATSGASVESGGGGDTYSIHISIPTLDRTGFDNLVDNKLVPAVVKSITRNRRGSRTKLRTLTRETV